uniref:Uncharacterized protein n=1 Tax=Tanacetum cinerariifolium TaxID=118510 RepID=A0A699SUS1_TANCI|nr:hypothetical protein [Tanacetum cinerariifolium]
MVAEDERQRAVSFENAKPLDSAAFKAFQRKISPYASNKERTGTKIVKDRTEYCTECRKEGHRREGCFKIIGYPDWWPGKKGDKSRGKAAYVETEISPIPGNTENIKPTANMAQKESEQGEWIFDSGCTEYITHLSNTLTNNKDTPFDNPVIIPNGDSIPLKEKENASSQGERK